MINLNETGGELWDLLKENTDEDKLLESMLEIYEIEPEQAQKSVRNFSEKIKRGGGFGGIKRKPCSKF